MKVVTYVEIDVDYCALSYGVTPCTADGPTKCFNSLATLAVTFDDHSDSGIKLASAAQIL